MSGAQNGGETPARFDTDLYQTVDKRQGYNLTAVDDEDVDDQLDVL